MHTAGAGGREHGEHGEAATTCGHDSSPAASLTPNSSMQSSTTSDSQTSTGVPKAAAQLRFILYTTAAAHASARGAGGLGEALEPLLAFLNGLHHAHGQDTATAIINAEDVSIGALPALHYACELGLAQAAAVLVAAGAHVNAPAGGRSGLTPLLAAARASQFFLADELMARMGAEPHACEADTGNTAFHHAAMHPSGHVLLNNFQPPIIAALLSSARNSTGHSPIELALAYGNVPFLLTALAHSPAIRARAPLPPSPPSPSPPPSPPLFMSHVNGSPSALRHSIIGSPGATPHPAPPQARTPAAPSQPSQDGGLTLADSCGNKASTSTNDDNEDNEDNDDNDARSVWWRVQAINIAMRDVEMQHNGARYGLADVDTPQEAPLHLRIPAGDPALHVVIWRAVPGPKLGAIIGKAGAVARPLQQRHGVLLLTPVTPFPRYQDSHMTSIAVLAIKGLPEAVLSAWQSVLELVRGGGASSGGHASSGGGGGSATSGGGGGSATSGGGVARES